MLSIGEIVDRLVIENIKIFNVRERLNSDSLSDEEYVYCENKMNILNENRGIILQELDKKIDNVLSGKDKNVYMKHVKTYYHTEE
jgi:thermostable 8-oxoguanine DNA glycosylase